VIRRRGLVAGACGITSILLWSASVPGTRLAIEGIGLFRAAAAVLVLGGCFLILLTSARNRGIRWVKQLSRKHLVLCGPLFAAYEVLLYTAIGLARSRGEAIAAGLANYLWPTMILIFSILILKQRARRGLLAIGIVVALAGVAVSSSISTGGLGQLAHDFWPVPPAIGIALLAAILWGLYSVLAHKYPQRHPMGAVGVYLLVAGATLAAFQAGSWQAVRWNWSSVVAVIYMALLPNSLAYWFWEIAVRDGSVHTLGALANLIPVLSAGVGTVVLGIGLRWEIFLGAALVATGAMLSHAFFRRQSSQSVRARSDPPPESHSGFRADPGS